MCLKSQAPDYNATIFKQELVSAVKNVDMVGGQKIFQYELQLSARKYKN